MNSREQVMSKSWTIQKQVMSKSLKVMNKSRTSYEQVMNRVYVPLSSDNKAQMEIGWLSGLQKILDLKNFWVRNNFG